MYVSAVFLPKLYLKESRLTIAAEEHDCACRLYWFHLLWNFLCKKSTKRDSKSNQWSLSHSSLTLAEQ